MAILDSIQRGQPLDISVLSNIVNAINSIDNRLNSTQGAVYSTIVNPSQVSDVKQVKTPTLKIVTGYLDLGNKTIDDTGITFSYPFAGQGDFKKVPVVTVTPTTSASKLVSVVLTLVTTSRVEGKIMSSNKTDAKIALNIIAIGESV